EGERVGVDGRSGSDGRGDRDVRLGVGDTGSDGGGRGAAVGRLSGRRRVGEVVVARLEGYGCGAQVHAGDDRFGTRGEQRDRDRRRDGDGAGRGARSGSAGEGGAVGALARRVVACLTERTRGTLLVGRTLFG